MRMRHGLPQITVPLPSRDEPCMFTLKPVTHTIGDLLRMLKEEDAGIDRAVVRSASSGVRIASTTSVQTLLQEDFDLVINDTSYRVHPPPATTMEISEQEQHRLGDVRNLVGQLYEALNMEEHQARQERRLVEQIEALQTELAPLEQQRRSLAVQAERRTTQLTWLGLGMMSVQFGILARLTWWEYSWDIMEPGMNLFDDTGREHSFHMYVRLAADLDLRCSDLFRDVWNRNGLLRILRAHEARLLAPGCA